MTFGKRLASEMPSSRVGLQTDAPQTRCGGYWLALAAVPVTLAVVTLISGLVHKAPLADLLTAIPVSAVSLTMVAALVFLLADFVLRALGWIQPWLFAVVCGLALYGLCFVTPVRGINLVLLSFIPGLVGGWVLGWSRR